MTFCCYLFFSLSTLSDVLRRAKMKALMETITKGSRRFARTALSVSIFHIHSRAPRTFFFLSGAHLCQFSFSSFFLRVSFVCEIDTRRRGKNGSEANNTTMRTNHILDSCSLYLAFHWSETDVREKKEDHIVFINDWRLPYHPSQHNNNQLYETRMALGAKIHKLQLNKREREREKKQWGRNGRVYEQREKDTWPDSQQLCVPSSCECCTKMGGSWGRGVKWAWYDATCHARPNSSHPWHVMDYFLSCFSCTLIFLPPLTLVQWGEEERDQKRCDKVGGKYMTRWTS